MKKFLKILSKNIIYYLLLGIIAIFIFILYNLNKTVDHLSKDMVEKSLLRTDLELENFFSTIREDILIIAQEHKVQDYDNTNYVHLNAEFRPLIENKRQLSSVLMATSEGDEFLLLDLDTSWMFRMTFDGSRDSMPDQLYWNKDEYYEPHYRNRKDVVYDPRERPWFQNAMEHDEMHVNWTEPYTFFTTKDPGITISSRWHDTLTDRDIVVAFDVLLTDISKFTTEMEISEDGFVFVLTEDERVIGLPAHSGFDEIDDIRANVLKSYKDLDNEPINKTVDIWNNLGKKDSCFTFTSGGQSWWGSIEEYAISSEDKLLVGVAVPETDFVGSIIHSENIIIVGFIIVLIFFVYILKAYRDKNKANDQLREQKAEIVEKNSLLSNANEEILTAKHEIEIKSEEILDSINYAKRIQDAILPPSSYWNEKLKNSFVLYLPKDIVAGDFYWMETVGDTVLFAAADCTGHGVPGAMVSVVCHNALNRAVREFGVREPAKILDKVTDLVIETFAKSDEEVKDGMDISLCALHLSEMTLEYAGAHNPLWLIREGNEEYEGLTKNIDLEETSMYEVKGDKQPIGKFAYRQAFTNHLIKIQKGDLIYLSSDGFPDQFGGPKGKKLKSKTFKNMLLDLRNKTIDEQEKYLSEQFEVWMGDLEQLDDVCVIGVRI